MANTNASGPKIKFGELKIGEIAKQHIEDCLRNHWVTMGPKVELLEQKLAGLFGYKYCVMVNSGTSAVMAACMSLYNQGAKPGDYIICPALSFIATANAIRAAGFEPYFIDIKSAHDMTIQSYLDNLFKRDLDRNIAGIVAVNLMGTPCDGFSLQKLCFAHNIKLIIDNCEAYGSKLNEQFALGYGDMECISMYTAHIVQSVEGGAVFCKSKEIYNLLCSIRSHGRPGKSTDFIHDNYGLNLKPTDLHACIGLEQVDDFWNNYDKRKGNLSYMIDSIKNNDFVVGPRDTEVKNCAPHALSIVLKEPNPSRLEKMQATLTNNGIQWKTNFGCMPHHQCFRYHFQHNDYYPVSEHVGRFGIHVGTHRYLSKDDISTIIRVINEN